MHETTGSYEKEYNNIVNNIDEIEPTPYFIVNNKGYNWYTNPQTKKLVRIANGTEVVVMPYEYQKGKVLVRAEMQFLLIPEDEVIEVGYN